MFGCVESDRCEGGWGSNRCEGGWGVRDVSG